MYDIFKKVCDDLPDYVKAFLFVSAVVLFCILFYIEEKIMALKGSKTEQNLKDAFAVNRKRIVDIYISLLADVEGQNDIAQVFRSTAEGETGHAHGHLEYLEKECGPNNSEPIVIQK